MHTKALGDLGENIACQFIQQHGFTVLDRNYRKKWGELDIVAERGEKRRIIHFFEVKSVTAAHALRSSDAHTPEENVHRLKARHIRTMIKTYLAEKKRGAEAEFHFHVLSVYMDLATRRARVKWLEDVIL